MPKSITHKMLIKLSHSVREVGFQFQKQASKALLFSSHGSSYRYASSCSTLFINPDPNVIPKLTTLEMLNNFTEHIGASKNYGSPSSTQEILERRRKLVDLLPKSQNELPPRRMKDSFVSAVIPLSENPELRERYLAFNGGVRIGRLLEELDVFAVWICYNHILNPKAEGHPNPHSVVTALVDTINFSTDPINTNTDIRLSGHLSWVGKSSMEVSLLVDQQVEPGSCKWKKLTSAVFVFVARDPMNQGSAFVNPLVADTPEEEAYISLGKERSVKRKLDAQQSLFLKPPTEEEREIIHNLFLSTVDAGYCGFRPSVLSKQYSPHTTMDDLRLNTLLLCHPQYRNRFNKIFGGFIMRQAMELAFSNVYLFSKNRPQLINIDDILFRKPVEIGSILRFGAEIGYVEGNYVHTPVIAEVLMPESGKSDVTNIFHFTFRTDSTPPTLMPYTYQESMMYLNSRRHFKEMMNRRYTDITTTTM